MSFKNRILDKFRNNNKFAFSIIIAVYNTEKYLDETVESILNQSFDFAKVQVILVDDGSSDKSGQICKEYLKKYPDNFVYIYQENQGQSIARNNGLDYVEGEFVNFLDSDDKLDPNTLNEVYKHFKKWGGNIDVIAIPRYTFGRLSSPLMFYERYQNARIVDILREYDFPQVSVSASFIRSDAITQKFNPDVVISEDSLFINKIILEKCKFGVVPTRYLYRKREDEDSTIDTRKTKKAYFSTRIELYLKELISDSLNRYGEVLKYIQSVLIYDLHWLFVQNSEIGVLDSKETEMYYRGIHDVIKYVDDDIILSQNYRKSLKYRMLSVKYNESDYNIEGDFLQIKNRDFDRLSNYMIYITCIEINENQINIEFFYEFYPIDFTISAYINNRTVDLEYRDVDETIALGRTILNKYYYSVNLPIDSDSNEISFRRKLNGNEYDIKLKNRANLAENVEIGEFKINF